MSPELGRLLALRRVRRGGIARFDGRVFIDHGCPVPGYIGSSLAALLADGQIRTGHPQDSTGYLPLLLTDKGQASYAELTDSYQRQLRASRSGALE
ncbi:MAG: hypothetical protein ACRDSL_21135 [Pseudonocardiaceae bacterium]